MTVTTPRVIYRGTEEYLTFEITAAVELDAQPVEFSFDRETWHTGAWVGTAGTTRNARFLADETTLPATAGYHSVYYRITDAPEIPIRRCGYVVVVE